MVIIKVVLFREPTLPDEKPVVLEAVDIRANNRTEEELVGDIMRHLCNPPDHPKDTLDG